MAVNYCALDTAGTHCPRKKLRVKGGRVRDTQNANFRLDCMIVLGDLLSFHQIIPQNLMGPLSCMIRNQNWDSFAP